MSPEAGASASAGGGGGPSKRSSRVELSEVGGDTSSGATRHRAASHAQVEMDDRKDGAAETLAIGSSAAEYGGDDDDEKRGKRARFSPQRLAGRAASSFFACLESKRLKRLVSLTVALLFLLFVADLLFAPPDKRLINPSTFRNFLTWVQTHPKKGLAAFVVVYAMTVVCLLPGTPLTLGSGYIYKAAYGWGAGITIGAVFSTLGSLLGSVTCFLLGRYLMRDRVRMWVRNYPMFDALDAAVAENGFKIMALLYLTPVLPLGPVSYMCGTTSMALAHFAAAKIACLPLMTFYVFLGASTGTIIHGKAKKGGSSGGSGNASDASGGGEGAGEGMPDIMVEGESTSMIIFGVCLSALSVALISHVVKRELLKILDKQKAEGEKLDSGSELVDTKKATVPSATDDAVEMNLKDGKSVIRQRSHALGASHATDDAVADEDQGKGGHLA